MINMRIDMNIANKITIFRIVAIPVYLVLIYFDTPWSNILSAAVFTLAGASDFLDGYLARKLNLVSDFGKIADPVADKILVTAALIALVGLERLPGWIAILMLSRDFVIGALRDLSSSRGVIIPAGIWGKLKTATQMVAVGMITLSDIILGINWATLGMVVMYVALALSLYSAYVYIKEYQESGNDTKTEA